MVTPSKGVPTAERSKASSSAEVVYSAMGLSSKRIWVTTPAPPAGCAATRVESFAPSGRTTARRGETKCCEMASSRVCAVREEDMDGRVFWGVYGVGEACAFYLIRRDCSGCDLF